MAVNNNYIRAIEKVLTGDSVAGDHVFNLDPNGPRSNTVDYFYFIDEAGDQVVTTGGGIVTITMSSGASIFYDVENGSFLASAATSSDRERPSFNGKTSSIKVSFSGDITGAVGFVLLLTKNSEAPSSMDIYSTNGVDVHIQDQHSPTLILPMVNQITAGELSAEAVVDAYTVPLVSVTGFAVGQHFRIINPAVDRYYFGTILSITDLVIGLDNPIDYPYVIGAECTGSNKNMNVNGSVTPVIFTLRTGAPSIPSEIDVTRIIISCTASTAVDLNKFGNLAALTRGIVLRRLNGEKFNIFNAKTNLDLANIGYTFTSYQASNPAQAVDGFVFELTFAGQSNIGVTLRIMQDENLEMVIQDDLTGLDGLYAILEGHSVIGM